MNGLLERLERHYTRTRAAHPHDRLLILFDVDGTIVDMRRMMCHVLHSFDRAHGTCLFLGLGPDDVTANEDCLGPFLEHWGVAPHLKDHLQEWYLQHRYCNEALQAAHQPFWGVLDLVRWFQEKPDTLVGLNSGRPETSRRDTLSMLNVLGGVHGVRFSSNLLSLVAHPNRQSPSFAKVEGLRKYQREGFRVVTVFDDQLTSLGVMKSTVLDPDILFVHTDRLLDAIDLRELQPGKPGTHWGECWLAGYAS